MTFKIHILGVSPQGLTLAQRELLGQSALIIGSQRLLAMFGHCTIPTMDITPLAAVFPAIEKALDTGDVTVLASGDPLFYGIGRRLLDHFGSEPVEILPSLSSMQDAACRFKIPWDDARLISLHGRHHHHLAGILLSHPKTFIFTDQTHSPAKLAQDILTYLQSINDHLLQDQCQIMVAENIGADDEALFSGSLQETAIHQFTDLNVMCLLSPARERSCVLGLSEQEIAHSRGLITKNEVRAVTLHHLCLPRQGVLWDIGAGSGSISLEAARLNPDLIIYAIEKNHNELTNIKENIRRFNCYNIIPVAGMAMDVLPHLPAPNRVFIGGNSGQLAEIIRETSHRLETNGLLVINGVIEDTITRTPQLMTRHGFRVKSSLINITRTNQTDESVTFNPITIFTGGKVS